ncbi:MAG: hypothetical protein KAI89_00465 [Emcibacter sp.]|nr:hypothetical protein [Emcibacter sp.]
MTKKFRFLPLSIIVMSMVLGVKIVDFSIGVEVAFAQNNTNAAEPDASQKPAEHEEEVASQETAVLQISSLPTRKEIEYLQKLSERRAELDRRSRELDDREKLLEAVELRIVERTESLKKIKATIEAALAKHAKREKKQLDSLVKIYSAMKPKEAAQIFNNLDEDVLLAIVENMKEKKMGAILAKMNLDKAKKLTVNLATREKLPEIEG